MFKNILLSISIGLILLLTGCGGGGASDPVVTKDSTISGVYAVSGASGGLWSFFTDGTSTSVLTERCSTDEQATSVSVRGSQVDIILQNNEGTDITLDGQISGNSISGTYIFGGNTGTWSAVKTSEAFECGSTYKVYGTNTSWFDIANSYGVDVSEVGYNPEEHGLTLLGSAVTSQTFSGSYYYYLIVTNDANRTYVSSIEGTKNVSFIGRYNFTGNIDNNATCSADDAISCAMKGSAFIGVNATNDGITDLTVTVSAP